MMELVDVQDLGSCGAIRVGSSPTARTTSEQAAYRLLRLFSKVRARSLRCSSFPNRTRFAGLRFGFGRDLERKSILTPYSKKESRRRRLCRLGPVDIGGADTHCPLQLRNSRHRSVSALRRKLHSGRNFFPFRSETVPVSFRRRTFLLQIGKEE